MLVEEKLRQAEEKRSGIKSWWRRMVCRQTLLVEVAFAGREVVESRESEVEGVEVKQGGTPSQSGTPQLQAVLKSNGGSKLTKNFATPDCSAKIVAANPGSQGASNVISHSKDEYFLNKCTDKSWFVVELCESIKALKVQLANFELYSSSPKEVRVSLGNVWPGRAQDWVEFGTFLYKDERAVQTFKSEQVSQSSERENGGIHLDFSGSGGKICQARGAVPPWH